MSTNASLPVRPPLGLPKGSVRALLTLMLVAVVCLQVARGLPLDPLWTETLAIALAHYFTTRRFLDLTPDQVRDLKVAGIIQDESRPLYLPGFTIRGLIILSFLGLALHLQGEGRLNEPQAVAVLGLVGAYLLGVIGQSIRHRFFRSNNPRLKRIWEDFKALMTLGVLGVALGASIAGRSDALPDAWREVTLGLTLFYFGSR